MSRKIFSAALTAVTAVSMSGAMLFVPVAAQAQSSTDLQAQITLLLAQIAQLQAQLNAGAGAGTSYNFTRNLTVGSTGADVKELQQFLNGQGFKIAASGAGSPGMETTYFGALTKAALAKWQAANGVSPAVGYFGPITRSKIASMTPGTPGTPPPTGGFAASVALDNPTSANLPLSATNVPFLKVRFTGSGTITSLTAKRIGAGKTTDLSTVYLYDGETRLTSGRSINSSTHEATFTGLNVQVSGEKVLTLRADVFATATAGDRNALQVVSVTSTPTVSGLPVSGNEMVITGATSGTLTATKVGSLANPNVGQQGAQLSQFRLSAAGEDVKVHRISLFYAGSMNKSYLTNLTLKNYVTGETLATSSGITARDLAVFAFSTPLTIAKGDSKTFALYGDIAGSARSTETIKFYVDEASDIYGTGTQYGYGAGVTKSAFDSDAADHHVLTLQGADFTITFNGPNAGDIAANGKDVTVFDFTIASKNQVEVRKLSFDIDTTNMSGTDTFTDFKVVDVNSGVIVSGPGSDITTSTDPYEMSDIFTINAGESKRMKVTVDVDSSLDALDTIKVALNTFGASDLKNLDNNTFLTVATDVSPNADVIGNLMTVKSPTLEVALAGVPASDSFVKGSTKVPLLGASFRAISADVKLTTVKISGTTASGSSSTNINSELLSLGLYDGNTLISSLKSFSGSGTSTSPSTATFSNLNYTIPQGQTKILTVKADLSSGSTLNYRYSVAIADVADTTGVDVVAVDSEGREVVYSGDLVNTTTESQIVAPTVGVTVLGAGSMTVVAAPDDTESKAGIVTANTTGVVLGKFRFTAASETMKVTKLQVLVNDSNSATATTTASSDEVSVIYLYDGAAQIASGAITGTGTNAGVVYFENSNGLFEVAKDATKTITVKGDTNSITGGADSSASVFVHVVGSGGPGYDFEAKGTVSSDTTITAASGKEKAVYKTKPTIAVQAPSNKLTGGSAPVIEFKITADAKEQVSFKAITLDVSPTGATVTAPTTSNVTLRNVTTSSNLTLATTTGAAIVGGGTDQFALYLDTEESIPAGQTYTYRVSLTFANVSATAGGASVTTKLVRNESTKAGATTYAAIADGGADENPSFIWSDNSATGHTESTLDWANGVLVETFPSDSISISN